MKKIFLLLTVLVFLISCSNSFEEIKEGMSQDEVSEILGKANKSSSSSSSSTTNGETISTSETTWSFEGLGTIQFENGSVTKIEKN